LSALGSDVRGYCRAVILIDIRQENPSTMTGKSTSYRFSNTVSGSGNNCHFRFQTIHRVAMIS
jgi:hypothetical protein